MSATLSFYVGEKMKKEKGKGPVKNATLPVKVKNSLIF